MDILEERKVNICFLTETWLKKANTSTITKIKNYSFKIFRSNTFGRGKGTAILLKNIKYRKVEIDKFSHFSTFEVVVIHLANTLSTTLVCIYRYYRFGSAFDSFITEFANFLSEISVAYDSYLLCGDFNVHLNEPANSCTAKFLDLLEEFDLRCSSPIIPTQKFGNTLDLVLSDTSLVSKISNVNVENHHVLLSDHFPIIFSLQLSGQVKELASNKPRAVRHYRNINSSEFQADLAAVVSDKLTISPISFKSAIMDYNVSLSECLDRHAPLRLGKVIHNDRPPWMDEEYVLARAKRRRLERIYKRSRCPFDKRSLQIQTNFCKELVHTKRSETLKQDIVSCSNDQRSLFKLVNKLTGKANSSILPEIYGDQDVLANEFNKYFEEKITNIKNEFTSSPNNIHLDALEDITNIQYDSTCLYNFDPCSTDEIENIIKLSGIVVSPADVFPAHLLSSNINTLIPYITYLINLSLSTGSMDGLTEAIVRPLLKTSGEDSNNLGNYRPVSNLQFIGKLIERVVLTRLQKHMDNINYCNNTQFGYKKNHSTELLLLKFLNDVLIGVDSKRGVVVLLIDLSAAFDTVNHRKLLNILCHELKIRDVALKWFKSFLLNRTQRILIGNSLSDSIDLSCGVPQGSVLGPILFNIYVNSLSNVFISNDFKTLSYADDNSGYQVFSLSSESNTFNNVIPACIDQLKSWMNDYFLKINEGKTKIIVFARPVFHLNLSQTNVTLQNGDVITITDRIKYLGFYFDKFLSLTSHVNKVASHCYQLLKTARKLRKYITQSQMESIVHCIISSRIDYCNILLFGAQKVNCVNKLQRVQNSASKVVLKKGRLQGCPSTQRLEILHWLPVEKRIVFKALVIIFKCFIGSAPILVSSLLVRKFPESTIDDDDYNCDFDDRLFYPNLSIGRRAFRFYAPRIWNALPMHLRESPNINIFKRKLKTYLWSSFDELMHNFNRFRNM